MSVIFFHHRQHLFSYTLFSGISIYASYILFVLPFNPYMNITYVYRTILIVTRLSFQGSLLFCEFDNFAVNKHSFPLPNSIHVALRNIGSIRLLAEIFQLFFSFGNPKWVEIKKLVAEVAWHQLGDISIRAIQSSPAENKLWTRSARCPSSYIYGILIYMSGLETVRANNIPLANPKLSTTGSKAETLMNDVPSFISSAMMRPRRLAMTP